LTEDARLVCKHRLGKLAIVASQGWVTIAGRSVLVEGDPERRSITGCPNIGATIKPCTLSLNVQSGYSAFVRIGGRPVCLENVAGLTDGTPPGVVQYVVADPGQSLVGEAP
jgi:hypothetical protein